jgi:hypothetical protein
MLSGGEYFEYIRKNKMTIPKISKPSLWSQEISGLFIKTVLSNRKFIRKDKALALIYSLIFNYFLSKS